MRSRNRTQSLLQTLNKQTRFNVLINQLFVVFYSIQVFGMYQNSYFVTKTWVYYVSELII